MSKLKMGFNGKQHLRPIKAVSTTVMFFGLCNSPVFQAVMDNLFKDMIDKGWIVIYMDGILISLETPELDQEWTRLV